MKSAYHARSIHRDGGRPLRTYRRSHLRGKCCCVGKAQGSLFFKDKTRLLLGDAKASLHALITEFKAP